MGCRRKMWLCLSLWYALVYVDCSHGKNISESELPVLPFPIAHKYNVATKLFKIQQRKNAASKDHYQLTGYAANAPTQYAYFTSPSDITTGKSREGYEKDLMLVLPVMPENRESNDSDLQMWYTQVPVTAIIEDDPKPKLTSRSDFDTYEDSSPKTDKETRHPYTNFLADNATPKPQTKTPLDYGYPESFKFVEDLNELPSNHKPEWASTLITETSKVRSTTEAMTTRYSPFEMFESVRPLDINKLLSVQPVQILVSDAEESLTTSPASTSTNAYMVTLGKRPYVKRPSKKPPKPKYTTTETVITEPELPSVNTQLPFMPSDAEQMYAAVRYTALFSESTKNLMPNNTKTKVALNINSIQVATTSTEAPTQPPSPTTTTTTTTTQPSTAISTTIQTTPSTTTTATTPAPTTIPVITTQMNIENELRKIASYWNSTTPKNNIENELMNIAGFWNATAAFSQIPIHRETQTAKPTNPPLSADMLTGEMKSMLIALGLLNPANPNDLAATFTTTTTERYFKKEPVTPNIDPESYSSFKKIPINQKPQDDKSGISDDMKDLLASFGLLPKKPLDIENSITRVSRHQNLNKTQAPLNDDINADLSDFFGEHVFNETSSSDADSPIDINAEMLSTDMKDTLSNIGLMKRPLSISISSSSGIRNAHVFQPTSQLEELNKGQKVQKINDVIESIKKLSKDTDANNLSIEEIEKQLENITATLDENFTEVNETLLTELNDIFKNDTKVKLIQSVDTLESDLLNSTTAVEGNTNAVTENSTSPVADLHELSDITVIITDEILPENKTDSLSPLSPEELQMQIELEKNEIKRQQPNDTSSSTESSTSSMDEEFPAASTVTEDSTTTFESSPVSDLYTAASVNVTTVSPVTTSTTVSDTKAAENNNAPIADLADSFGGGEVASEEPTTDDLPTPKPNGFYFYLDWNTFLNVGEEDKNPIRIRFSPRAGNAKNFIPIRVP